MKCLATSDASMFARRSSRECTALRGFPDRVLDVYDRRHQGDETQVALNHRKQRTDPCAVLVASTPK